MRDEKEEWKQTSCWWSKVSLLPDFLSLISLGDASDYPGGCPFLFLASSERRCCECGGALG